MYEYKVQYSRELIDLTEINQRAEEGWRLVAVLQHKDMFVAYFERRRESEGL